MGMGLQHWRARQKALASHVLLSDLLHWHARPSSLFSVALSWDVIRYTHAIALVLHALLLHPPALLVEKPSSVDDLWETQHNAAHSFCGRQVPIKQACRRVKMSRLDMV